MNRPKVDYDKIPKRDSPGFHEHWFAVGLHERDQAIYDAVHAEHEDLRDVEVAGENLRNFIVANIHDEDFMQVILDMINEFDFKV